MRQNSAAERSAIHLAEIRAGPEATRTCSPHVASTNLFQNIMSETPTRILALDPITKGFGYVVFELPFHLVSFDLKFVRGDKRAGAIARLNELLVRVRPNVLVLEDADAPGSRRQPRVRSLMDDLARLAREHGVAVHTVPRTAVLARFAPEGKRISKHAIAAELARFFPEIASQVPPRRRIWESEDHRTSIVDALALAVTYASA